jgi:hypothetical protein
MGVRFTCVCAARMPRAAGRPEPQVLPIFTRARIAVTTVETTKQASAALGRSAATTQTCDSFPCAHAGPCVVPLLLCYGTAADGAAGWVNGNVRLRHLLCRRTTRA